MKVLERLLLLFFALFLICGCREQGKSRLIEVKVIEYDVNYIDEKAGSIPTSILPEKMTLIFHGNTALANIEGFLGQFSLSYLADLKKEKVTTMLKIFDKSYYYEGNTGELPAGISGFNNMEITETEDTSYILGFLSRKYIIAAEDMMIGEIWSTRELNIEKPNIITPYSDIPGVLLQFYTELSVLKMLLIAEKYRENTINSDLLRVHDEYEKVSKAKMEKTLNELFK